MNGLAFLSCVLLMIGIGFLCASGAKHNQNECEKVIKRLRQDSTENAHLKRELRKCNSDTTEINFLRKLGK